MSRPDGEVLRVDVEDGKYTIVQYNHGGTTAYRHGLYWRVLTGDKLILAMAQEIEKLRAQLPPAKPHGDVDEKVRGC